MALRFFNFKFTTIIIGGLIHVKEMIRRTIGVITEGGAVYTSFFDKTRIEDTSL